MHSAQLPTAPAVPGATAGPAGTTFRVRSRRAEAVELCLFEPGSSGERRVPLERLDDGSWAAHVPGIRPGQRYGYRAHGPFDPAAGLRFNPAKLLVDPWARAIAGHFAWNELLLGHHADAPDLPDSADSAPAVPKSLVIAPDFDWAGDAHLRTPWSRTVIYECHVRGMTMRHPGVPEAHRGTFLGLAAEPVIEHLLSLGVTAVQLLPIQHHAIDRRLARLGLTNYWGYNSIGYFAPDPRFATGCQGQQVTEFREMVRRLHAAGLEVLLDVVYNHTAEGDATGPTLAFRGLDNDGYYRLDPADRRRYVDFTGVGNTVDAGSPPALELILESLRYWASEMHVDGFRFDLASSLGRTGSGFDAAAPFFDAVRRDRLLSASKLIAEPWDIGPGGYRLGEFPPGWAEWNDRFRDAARRFWSGRPDREGELAARMEGSADLFGPQRAPEASVNFVTCHDGFTLRDLVSYEHRHNQANGEDNRDGHHDNLSRNWGVEGPTDDSLIRGVRLEVMRGLLAVLVFSEGVPMLSHGDEIGRTQQGNNNAYCQDGPLSWLDWTLDEDAAGLLAFTRELFRIKASHRAGIRASPRDKRPGERVTAQAGRAQWLDSDGEAIAPEAWTPDPRAVQLMPAGMDGILLLFNPGEEPVRFRLPPHASWRALLGGHAGMADSGGFAVGAHGTVVLAAEPAGPAAAGSATSGRPGPR